MNKKDNIYPWGDTLDDWCLLRYGKYEHKITEFCDLFDLIDINLTFMQLVYLTNLFKKSEKNVNKSN